MQITAAQLAQIYAHAQKTYPRECCGFLLGMFASGGQVRRVRRATNQTAHQPGQFLISAEEFSQAQLAAEAAGLEIIGIYHSHPDWPAIPSQTDLDNAWPDAFFLITTVHQGAPLNAAVWRLANQPPRRFEAEPLAIVASTDVTETA